MPGLMMSIVMTTITKKLVNGMAGIAVALLILTQTRTDTVIIVKHVKLVDQFQDVFKPGLMMVIAMTITTKLNVNGMVVIAVPKLITLLTRTFTVQPVLHVKYHHQIVWMPGLVISIVMMSTTKLPVGGMVEIAVT